MPAKCQLENFIIFYLLESSYFGIHSRNKTIKPKFLKKRSAARRKDSEEGFHNFFVYAPTVGKIFGWDNFLVDFRKISLYFWENL